MFLNKKLEKKLGFKEKIHYNCSQILISFIFMSFKSTEKYIATGDVKFDLTKKKIHYLGEAGSVTYSPKSSKYLFKKNVVLKDLTNNRVIKAESVSLDLKTGLADIKGKKKKPVHFIFEIEDRK